MTQTVKAIYHGGALLPLKPLEGVAEDATVFVTVASEPNDTFPLADLAGSLPADVADEMLRVIEETFEQVNLRECK